MSGNTFGGFQNDAILSSASETGESGVRRAEDIGGQELAYAEIKAITSGTPP